MKRCVPGPLWPVLVGLLFVHPLAARQVADEFRPSPALRIEIEDIYATIESPAYFYLAENYRRLAEMQSRANLMDEQYARLSPDDRNLESTLNDNVAMHVILALGGARLAYDDMVNRHLDVARRRLTAARFYPTPEALETDLMNVIRGYEVGGENLADEYARVVAEYAAHVDGARQVELVFDYADSPAPRPLPLGGFRIEPASAQEASPAAQLFAGSLDLQLNDPVVEYWYLRYYRDEMSRNGWTAGPTDYFLPDVTDAEKERWMQIDLPALFQSERPIAVTLWIPNGAYTLYSGAPTGANLTIGEGAADRYFVTMIGSPPNAQVVVRPDPGTSGTWRWTRPVWTSTDFNIGFNERTRKPEGTIAGRAFQRWNDHVGFQAQGELAFRSHDDFAAGSDPSVLSSPDGSSDFFSKEFQADFGPVLRYRDFQFGLFQSLRYVTREDWDEGGLLGQFTFAFNYVFDQGNAGLFVSRSTSSDAVVQRVSVAEALVEESYLRTINQVGVNFRVAVHDLSYVEGTMGYLDSEARQDFGGVIRHVLPPWKNVRFTYEVAVNESFVGQRDSWRFGFGIRLGEWGSRGSTAGATPRDMDLRPMSIPRVRYERLTRVVRDGNRLPVAIAGVDQVAVRPGTNVCLDGSDSYDPDGDTITFAWSQTGGPMASLSNPETPGPCFVAGNGPSYVFQLVVSDSQGAGSEPDTVTISVGGLPPSILQFDANPSEIRAGETAELIWETENADLVRITGFAGDLPADGSLTVQPTNSTSYVLTAISGTGDSIAVASVDVKPPLPQIVSFTASPLIVGSGESTDLCWTVQNATRATLRADGTTGGTETPVPLNHCQAEIPSGTTTYTLTVYNAADEPVSRSVRVVVSIF